MSSKEEFIRHLEIALDVLDRVEGTTIYQIQKKTMGWTDKEYSKMLSSLGLFLIQVQQHKKEE